MSYIDDFENIVTEDQLEQMADALENEDFSAFEPASDVVYGMMKPNKAQKRTICVQIPLTVKDQLDAIAKSHNCSLSALVRAYTVDGISRELHLK